MTQGIIKNYNDRKAERAIISLSDGNARRKTELKVHNCIFFDVPQTDDCVFSATERDDGKGFGIEMVGVAVIPATFVCFRTLPRWLIWIVSKLGYAPVIAEYK